MIVAKGATLAVFRTGWFCGTTSKASLVIAARRLLAFFLMYPAGSCRFKAPTCGASASIRARNSGWAKIAQP
ncbi:MAG: hypothetical protein R3E68_00190 [Burkholderiaceae bacterium]